MLHYVLDEKSSKSKKKKKRKISVEKGGLEDYNDTLGTLN